MPAAGQTRRIDVSTNSDVMYRNINDDLYLEQLTNFTETACFGWNWAAVHGCYRFVTGGNKTLEGQAVC